VVTAGNPRSDAIQEYKLVGLRQRFFEITNPQILFFENDAAKQAENVLLTMVNNNDLPAGVTAPTFIIGQDLFPQTGFVNGLRHPQKESYGDGLKAIAESVGRFVVPVGETYTYDGKTYNELETVPAARFGVDASGNVIFARPQADDAVFSETGDNVLANYVQVTGEEIFDVIELEYATEIAGKEQRFFFASGSPSIDLDDAIPVPLRRSFVFGDAKTRRVVQLPGPTAFMNSDNELLSNSIQVTNPSGPITGGTATFPAGGNVFAEYGHVIANTAADLADGCIITLNIKPIDSDLSFSLSVGEGFPTGNSLVFGNNEETNLADNEQLTFVVLPASNFVESVADTPFDFVRPVVTIVGRGFELSNLNIYVPDVDAGGTKSNQFASGFVRDVQQDVAEVTLVNQFGPVAPRMVWTPEGESPVTVPVERIQYTLTTNDGLITQYELGQAFDAELLSERAVLKGLAREAVSE